MWDDELDNVIPSGLRPYVSFDYDMLARDLASDLHFVRDVVGCMCLTLDDQQKGVHKKKKTEAH